MNEKGDRRATYDFSTLPLSTQMQTELANICASLVKPTGAWRELPTSRQGWTCLKTFARWISDQGIDPESLDDLDPATWRRWRVSRPPTTGGRRALRVVARVLREHSGLRADTRSELVRRTAKDEPSEASYSDEDLHAIVAAAKPVFRAAATRIRKNEQHLAHHRAQAFTPGSDEFVLGEILETLAQTGDVPYTHIPSKTQRYILKRHRDVLGGFNREFTWKRLYLDGAEIAAAVVLLAVEQGWNATTILELEVPSTVIDDGQTIYTVTLQKRRRRPPHRYETRTLVDHGTGSNGRLMTRILAATSHARALRAPDGEQAGPLFVYHVSHALVVENPSALTSVPTMENVRSAFAARTGVRVNFRRIRKAVNVRHLRRPNQNTQNVHDQICVLSDPHTAIEAEAAIALGAEQAIQHAEKMEAAVLTENVAEGEDTVTASCTDTLRSPFAPWGVPCAASFLLCLACTNALVMPRHLGRLAYLYQGLCHLRGSISPAEWDRKWASHFTRLHGLRTEHYTNTEWEVALAEVSPSDRQMVDRLLGGDLDR